MTILIDNPQAWLGLRRSLLSLAREAGGAFKYVPNRGNAGDALIACGTSQFFDDCQLAPTYVTTSDIEARDYVVYAGGGNLVPEYNNCQRFLERCLLVGAARVLVLSHTIRGHEALLARLDHRFTLVCRDLASLKRVQATGTGAELLFAPDMALYTDVDRLFQRCDRYDQARLWPRFARHGQWWAYRQWRRTLERLSPPTDGRVEIIRADAEATAQRGDPAWDLPNFYGSKYRFREEAELVGRDLLGYFTQVRRVRTNRLHIGVAGALMGCEVSYLDNSYGKIRAVYDAWLSHLPLVRFESETGQTALEAAA